MLTSKKEAKRRKYMIKWQRMVITLKKNGFESSREVGTFRSCSSMLKHLRKEALRTDPGARIMELNGVPTLVIHGSYPPGMLTVCLVDNKAE
jgi:hypothetical protein